MPIPVSRKNNPPLVINEGVEIIGYPSEHSLGVVVGHTDLKSEQGPFLVVSLDEPISEYIGKNRVMVTFCLIVAHDSNLVRKGR